jgi:hypothetical protein
MEEVKFFLLKMHKYAAQFTNSQFSSPDMNQEGDKKCQQKQFE